MNVGIVGAGLIGQKRAAALGLDDHLIAVADTNRDRAGTLAGKFGATAHANWEEVVLDPNVHAVIVATTNNAIPYIAKAALENKKHVLIEKPGGRTVQELEELKRATQQCSSILRVGFNHRFHPALKKAKEVLGKPEVGDLMFIRARYGHGGRLGYEKEWRADPNIAGGGGASRSGRAPDRFNSMVRRGI